MNKILQKKQVDANIIKKKVNLNLDSCLKSYTKNDFGEAFIREMMPQDCESDEKKFKLNKIQRLLLVNQYKILAALDQDNRRQYEEFIEILSSGYSVFYDTLTDWISDDMEEKDGDFVLDVLDLYCAVEVYEANHGKLTNLRNTEFEGFNGNREFQEMIFTRFLIFKQQKFSELVKYANKTNCFNSHKQMRRIYEPIIKRWKENFGSEWPEKKEDFEKIFEKEG